jgi:hypothetical protein
MACAGELPKSAVKGPACRAPAMLPQVSALSTRATSSAAWATILIKMPFTRFRQAWLEPAGLSAFAAAAAVTFWATYVSVYCLAVSSTCIGHAKQA